jgi:Holliday junction DNA helicase RuvB
LLKMGLIQKTPRGRIATELAYRPLGLRYPRQMESNGLFSLSDE